jgi:methyltransferase (TIGR00027 family)
MASVECVFLFYPARASEQSIRANIDERRTPINALYRALFAFPSRFAEDRLAEAVGRSVSQYAIVGAGLDTFPWRQPAFAESIDIFYVDHPASLAWTGARIRERGLSTPSNLTYVAADLAKHELAERLTDLGFNRKAGAFFSLLGVTQYVSRDALDALFGFIASLPRGSEIVLSFVPPDDELDGGDLQALVTSTKVIGELGEPWITRFRASELVGHLSRLGFSDVFHVTSEDAHQLYFADRSDKLRAPALEQLIAAKV